MPYSQSEINNRLSRSEKSYIEKDYDNAVGILNDIIAHNPDEASAYRKMGYILLRTDTPQKALPYLEKAASLAGGNAANWIALGVYHKHLKHWQDALAAFEKALKLTEGDTAVQFEVFKIYRELNVTDKAVSMIESLVKTAPDNSTYLHQYAQILDAMERHSDALEQYDRLMRTANELSVGAITEWYGLMKRFGRSEELCTHLSELAESHPESTVLKQFYGQSLADVYDYEGAITVWEEVCRLDPKNAAIPYSIGAVYYIMGDFDRAKQYNDKALELDPLYPMALRALGTMHTFSYGDKAFKALNYAEAYLSDMPDDHKAQVHFALGKAYDDVGVLPTAFEHFRRGGLYHSKGDVSEYNSLSILTDVVKKNTKRTDFETSISGCRSSKPVFIVGMPRSGTTLMEQVLSGFEGMYAAGELPYCHNALSGIEVSGTKLNLSDSSPFTDSANVSLEERGAYYLSKTEAIAPEETQHIVDKMPDNFKFAGFIHLMLPDAAIIHARRHPVETCLSAYRLYFAEGHHWSDDLRTMGRYYRKYTELMTYWMSVLPEGSILEVRYEDMVNDLENQSKRIAGHIGVDWKSECLDFHRSKRAVTTASAAQVRKPIYKTSMNRWRKYEPYLQPLLDEIGDLVEAYETELDKGK